MRSNPHPRASVWVRVGLLAAMAALAGAAGWLSFSIKATETAFERTARYDVAWTTANARSEARELLAAMAVASEDGSEQSGSKAELAYEVVAGRVEGFGQGILGAEIRRRPSVAGQHSKALDAIRRLADRVPPPPAQHLSDETRAALADLIDAVDSIASETFMRGTEEAADAQDGLLAQQHAQFILLACLLACAAVLILVLWKQNALLETAHQSQKEAAGRFEFVAAHDQLTGLANRSQLTAELERHPDLPACLLIMDLDGFKPINDTLGHLAGDELLMSTGQRIAKVCEALPGSLPARFGGDEFVVLLRERDTRVALDIARGLLAAVREPHELHGHVVTVDASIGLSLAQPGNASESLRRADTALNRAKALGKGMACAWEPAMDDEIVRRRRLEAELAAALAHDQFDVVYQPIVDLARKTTVAVEALLRWQHPELGDVPPDEFIPAAEASGVIVELGRRVLERACSDALLLPSEVAVAVNLSAVQFMRGDLVATVAGVLQRTGLDAKRLKLEITETVLMQDEARSRAILGHLRKLGVAISLDDFGTGYSSLSYLRYGVDELKIDRSFVKNLADNPQSQAIVQTVTHLGRSLGMRVTAEGIEREDEAMILMGAGCNLGQGYHFGRPLPLREVLARLSAA